MDADTPRESIALKPASMVANENGQREMQDADGGLNGGEGLMQASKEQDLSASDAEAIAKDFRKYRRRAMEHMEQGD